MTKADFLVHLIAIAITAYVVRLTAESLRGFDEAFGSPANAPNSQTEGTSRR